MVSQPQSSLSKSATPLFESRQPPQQPHPEVGRPPHGGLLLCCVCHEHNTTFRYEVVYKAGDSISTLTFQPPNGLVALPPGHPARCPSARITELTDDGQEIQDVPKIAHNPPVSAVSPAGTVSLFSDDQSHEYYNFPPRHPRHGHLKWPVWTPNPSPTPNGSLSQPSFIATYPDYPIHIPTVTLKRISSARKGKS
jgi:hypothetical protein